MPSNSVYEDLEDPFEALTQEAPIAQSVTFPPKEEDALEDPFESLPSQREVLAQEKQTQFIPQMGDVQAQLDNAKRVLSDQTGISEFSLERTTSFENLKPAIIATTATAGAVAGTPAGPLGIVGGGTLGAGMGRALIGAIEQEPISDQLKGIGTEMRNEAIFGGGAVAIGPIFKMMGPRFGKMFGLDDEGIKQLVKDAERNKIPFALQDVVGEASKKTGKLIPAIAAGYPKVVGVFPFVAGPQKKSALRTAAALESAVNHKLNAMAPNVTLNKLGIDIYDAAKHTSKEFRVIANGLYDNFYKIADDMGNPKVIPTKPLRTAIDRVRSLKQRPTITVKGKEVPIKAPQINKELDTYINDLTKLDDYISPSEMRVLEEDVNRLSDVAGIKGFDVKQLTEIKQGLEIAKNSMDASQLVDPQQAVQLRNALDMANEWYGAGMTTFATPSGKKFTKVDKNIFNGKHFKAGEITADKLGPVVVNSADSPQMIKDFRKIVGPSKMKDVSREFIDKARGSAVTDDVLDFNQLERGLKLDTSEGVEVMEEMLKGTGLNVEKLQSLIRVGKIHGKIDISDASSFLKRRLILGGIGTAGLLTQPKKLLLTVAPAMILLRGGSKFLGSPKVLKWMTTALDDTVNDKIRRVAASQLINAFESSEQQQEEKE